MQTLFAIVLIISALQVTEHPALSVLGLLWLFHATTEQSLFIALIFCEHCFSVTISPIIRLTAFVDRLKYSKLLVQRTLYFSAVQSLYVAVTVYSYTRLIVLLVDCSSLRSPSTCSSGGASSWSKIIPALSTSHSALCLSLF